MQRIFTGHSKENIPLHSGEKLNANRLFNSCLMAQGMHPSRVCALYVESFTYLFEIMKMMRTIFSASHRIQPSCPVVLCVQKLLY